MSSAVVSEDTELSNEILYFFKRGSGREQKLFQINMFNLQQQMLPLMVSEDAGVCK